MEITRKIKIEGEQVEITHIGKEETTKQGLKQIYSAISNDLYQIKGEADKKRSMLKELDKVVVTDEIKEFVKQLELAQQLMAKKEVISELKEFDIKIAGKEGELAELSKYFIQIQEEEKVKDGS